MKLSLLPVRAIFSLFLALLLAAPALAEDAAKSTGLTSAQQLQQQQKRLQELERLVKQQAALLALH